MIGRKALYVSVFIVVILLGALFLHKVYNTGYVKIVKSEDVPEKIQLALKEAKLERGVYLFTPNFAEDLYIAICCGDEDSNVYDVEIKQFNSTFYPLGTDLMKYTEKAEFNIHIEEQFSESYIDYGEEFDSPLVLIKIKQPSPAFENKVHVFSGDEQLSIRRWWGRDAIGGEAKDFTYQVLQCKEDIPDAIWSKIEELELRDIMYGGAYVFHGSSWSEDEKVQYSLIYGGKSAQDSFKVAFENVLMYPDGQYGSYHLLLRRIVSEGRYEYSEGFKYAFVIVKLADKDGHPRPKYWTMLGQTQIEADYCTDNTTNGYVLEHVLPYDTK